MTCRFVLSVTLTTIWLATACVVEREGSSQGEQRQRPGDDGEPGDPSDGGGSPAPDATCGTDGGGPLPDASPDPFPDAGPDPFPDAGPDPFPDAGNEPFPDAGW